MASQPHKLWSFWFWSWLAVLAASKKVRIPQQRGGAEGMGQGRRGKGEGVCSEQSLEASVETWNAAPQRRTTVAATSWLSLASLRVRHRGGGEKRDLLGCPHSTEPRTAFPAAELLACLGPRGEPRAPCKWGGRARGCKVRQCDARLEPGSRALALVRGR